MVLHGKKNRDFFDDGQAPMRTFSQGIPWAPIPKEKPPSQSGKGGWELLP